MRHSILLAIGLFSCLSVSLHAGDTMSPDIARQLGLVEAWSRAIHAPLGEQSIVDQQLYVHSADPYEYVEVVGSKDGGEQIYSRIRIDTVKGTTPEERLSEAQRLSRNEVRRLKRRGMDGAISSRKVQRVRLYSVASDGVVESRNAETGDLIWSKPVGNRALPFMGLGVGDSFVSVINGSNLIQLDAVTGEQIQSIRTMRTPLYGAVNSGRFAMVPTVGGGVNGFPLYDITRDPFNEIVSGNALHLPTKAPGSTRVAWGTERGFVYVMELQGKPSILFRLNTDGIVNGRVASGSGNRFFFASDKGQAYGLRATRSGVVLWSQPFGEPFYNEPFIIDNHIFLRSTYGNLFMLDAQDGSMLWEQTATNIEDVITVIGDHVFTRTMSKSLEVIDRKTGSEVGRYHNVPVDRLLINRLTNRLYLVNDAGHVQCLRPVDSELPSFTVQPEPEAPAKSEEAGEVTTDGGSPFDDGSDMGNPFGAGNDGGNPFGGGDSSPFGDGGNDEPMDNPFGGGGDDEPMDNPFGGDNPFG